MISKASIIVFVVIAVSLGATRMLAMLFFILVGGAWLAPFLLATTSVFLLARAMRAKLKG